MKKEKGKIYVEEVSNTFLSGKLWKKESHRQEGRERKMMGKNQEKIEKNPEGSTD